MRSGFTTGALAAVLTSCGDSELYLYSPTAITADIIITIDQVNDNLWTANYEEGPRSDMDILPLGDTVTLRFRASESGHKLSIPEFGFTLPGVAGQTTEGWIAVTKPVEAIVQCETHPDEKTGLTLQFK